MAKAPATQAQVKVAVKTYLAMASGLNRSQITDGRKVSSLGLDAEDYKFLPVSLAKYIRLQRKRRGKNTTTTIRKTEITKTGLKVSALCDLVWKRITAS